MSDVSKSVRDSQQTMDVLFELSKLLNTGLDKETLGILVALCENGADPDALAMVIQELRREAVALVQSEQAHQARVVDE
eukprot:CAMPEP_0184541470 /NCGR_PEP_ID=MMETSP0199_2-20130426/1395_1 /TAXON_ID=1112570 /ORGANISM="Thraustochytrium sp., Strain LLF1b" /LENGTH=78 /DNA_ID=CAMNT_0026935195 /DNA_START=171 /DNA_END=407 /DNA_ORIENTATION=+